MLVIAGLLPNLRGSWFLCWQFLAEMVFNVNKTSTSIGTTGTRTRRSEKPKVPFKIHQELQYPLSSWRVKVTQPLCNSSLAQTKYEVSRIPHGRLLQLSLTRYWDCLVGAQDRRNKVRLDSAFEVIQPGNIFDRTLRSGRGLEPGCG